MPDDDFDEVLSVRDGTNPAKTCRAQLIRVHVERPIAIILVNPVVLTSALGDIHAAD